MSDLLGRVAELRARGDYAAVTAEVPYARWLGITIEPLGDDIACRLAYQPMLIGNPTLPALHGGTLGALLESTAIFQVMWSAESIVLPRTISITVDYLRSGRPVDTLCAATITRRGRRVVNVRAEAWQEDRQAPIAAAHAHFLVKPAVDEG